MHEWIETSTKLPKHGVPVLIAIKNDYGVPRRLRAIYAARLTLPLAADIDGGQGEYDADTDEYYCPEGWYENNEYDETNWGVEGDVTHWMPLPEFPEGYNA